MKNFDIITIGAATRDVFLRSKAIKVVRDDTFSTGEAECFALGSKLDIDELVFETGGGATNTAVGFARQGYATAFIGKIGAYDARGREILTALQAEKVSTELVVKDKHKSTAYSVLLLTPRGERTALVYRGASADFQPKDFPWSKIRAKWLYVSSLAGELQILKKIWAHAAKHHMHIAWNPGAGELALGREKLLPLIKQTAVFSVNQEEAAKLMNTSRHQDEQAFHQIRALAGGITLVTQGSEGSLAGTAVEAWHCGTHEIHVVDTTGAGDAFGCGFVGSFAKDGNIPRALQFGTANSESVIGVIGAKQGLLRRLPTRKVATVIQLTL